MNTGNITVRRHSIMSVDTVEIFHHELDSIEKESLDVGQDLQFGSIALSAFITLVITLSLADIPSPRRFAAFWASAVAAGVFAAYFFIGHFRKRRAFKSTIQIIRERQVGPMGQEGNEMRPAEVAHLPVTPADTIATFAADAVVVKSESPSAENLPPTPGNQSPQPGEQK